MYAGTYQRGLFKSTNGGASWVRVNPAAVRFVIVDPNDRETIYITADGTAWNATTGIFKSTDGGSTWAAAGLQGKEGDPLGNGPTLLAVDPQHSQTLYASRGAGLVKSTDGGSTWQPAGPPARDVQALAIDPRDSETLYAGTDGGIFKSTDGGHNWTVLQAGLGTSDWSEVLVLDPSNPATLYAASDNGVLKSTDSGRSWQVSTAGMAGARVDEIAAASRGSAYALVGSQGLFKRAQHGWRPVVTRPAAAASVMAVDPQSPETLYVATDDGRIFGTRDGGDSWKRLRTPSIPKSTDITTLAVDPQNPRTLYAGTYAWGNGGRDGIFKSTDGGATWFPEEWLDGPDEVSVLAVDPRNPKNLHASGLFYYRSDDGGTLGRPPTSHNHLTMWARSLSTQASRRPCTWARTMPASSRARTEARTGATCM